MPFIVAQLSLTACHRAGRAPSSPDEKPLAVATAIAGCANATDCEKKCAAGAAGACVEAGRLHEFGHAGARDATRAYDLYERACTLSNPSGCYNAAVLLEGGKGVRRDVDHALTLYKRVCDSGSKTACARAESLGEQPR